MVNSFKILYLLCCIATCSAPAHIAAAPPHGALSPAVASLQVRNPRNPQAPAVITMGSDDRLVIEFDELASAARDLRWSVAHCDADWQPDGLLDLAFTDGLNEATVDSYEYSQATLTHYVHYTIRLPDARVPLKVSGNYILKIYEEYEPDKPLAAIRFSVAEGSARVNAEVSPKTDIDYLQAHQQLSIAVDTKGLALANPYTDLKIAVVQNPDDERRVLLTSPGSVRGHEVRYEHLRPLIFKGGNEYRRFETVSTSYPGMGVERVGKSPDGYFAELRTDFPRGDTRYQYDQTQCGRFTIREYNSDRSNTEAEYITTLFTLESPKLPGVEVHLEGELTGKRFGPHSRMDYNPFSGCYEKTLYLKQGAYDYRYVAVNPADGSASLTFTEGDFCDTGNQYVIYVYYRLPGERYDRLATVGGAKIFNSQK